MNPPIHSTATAVPPPRLWSSLSDATDAARAAVKRIDAWLAARKRAAEDRDTLANMSARQLRDIGIVRSETSVIDPTRSCDYLR